MRNNWDRVEGLDAGQGTLEAVDGRRTSLQVNVGHLQVANLQGSHIMLDQSSGEELQDSEGTMLIEYQGKMPRLNPTIAYIAPGAILVGDVTVLAGASVWFNAVIRADFNSVVIGEGSNIQDNAVVHCGDTATVLGKNVTIGHGAIVEGCRIGDGAVIGMNAVVLPGSEIGEGVMVAAGAVVSEGSVIPPFHLAAGVPAKVVKELEGSSQSWVGRAATEYRQLTHSFLRQGQAPAAPG